MCASLLYVLVCREGEAPPAPQRSFAMHWLQRCEGSWRRAFLLFGAGIPTMFANLAVAAWIKFDTSLVASVLTTVVMAASLAFMAYFHRKWTTHILATEQLEQVGGADGAEWREVLLLEVCSGAVHCCVFGARQVQGQYHRCLACCNTAMQKGLQKGPAGWLRAWCACAGWQLPCLQGEGCVGGC